MYISRPDIQAVFRITVQKVHGDEVGHKSDEGDNEHEPRFDRFGGNETDNRFVDQVYGYGGEHGSVYECGKDLKSLVPERFSAIRTAFAYFMCDPGQQQRKGVAEVVNGIGDQGQTVGQYPANDLNQRDKSIQQDRGNKPAGSIRSRGY